MRVSPLSSRTSEELRAEAKKVSGVRAVDAVHAPGSGADESHGKDTADDEGSAVIRDLLNLRESIEERKPDEDSPYRQKAYEEEPPELPAKRLTARLVEIEREVRQVVERHREVLEQEVPSETRALEDAAQDAFVELAARPVPTSPTSEGGGQAGKTFHTDNVSKESRYELYYDHVSTGLDRIVASLIASRRDSPPGSLLNVEA